MTPPNLIPSTTTMNPLPVRTLADVSNSSPFKGTVTGLAASALAACMLVMGMSVPANAQQARAFTVDHAIDLVGVSGARISPDGSRVLFNRSDLDWDENKRESRIWIASPGDEPRPFTGQVGDSRAEWSPDGRWVSFVRSVGESEKTSQLFLLPTGGGEAVQLTGHSTSVGAYSWTSDSRQIVFVANDSLTAEERGERKKGDDAIFVDEGPNGQTRSEWNGVWSVEVAFSAEPVQATRWTPSGIRVGGFAMAPGGAGLAYTFRGEGRRNDGNLSEIARVGAPGEEPRAVTSNAAPESGLMWSPDGSVLAFIAPDLERWELDQGNLYLMDARTGEVREPFPDFDGDYRGMRWKDNSTIDALALVRTTTAVFRMDVEAGTWTTLADDPSIFSGASFNADHSRMATIRSAPTMPGDVYLVDLSGSQGEQALTRLTDVNPTISTAALDLAEPRLVQWESRDGLEIEGVLYVPERDRAGAMVLEIHGGPAGVFTRGFDADAQLLVAQGYAVLQPNVRGSSGYGDDLLRGNMNDIGGGDFDDLMTGVDQMIEDGIAHSDSLAVKGWSYGGILGGWTITKTERFKAASLGAMVADWRSEFGAGFNFDVVRWYLGGDPWSNPEQWTERSAYTHLDKVTTPTILFHGAQDRTDTMEQSMNFFAGLRHLGVDARLLVFPREGHGISEPRHRRTLLVEEMRWLQKWVRGEAHWTAPERPDPKAAVAAPVS